MGYDTNYIKFIEFSNYMKINFELDPPYSKIGYYTKIPFEENKVIEMLGYINDTSPSDFAISFWFSEEPWGMVTQSQYPLNQNFFLTIQPKRFYFYCKQNINDIPKNIGGFVNLYPEREYYMNFKNLENNDNRCELLFRLTT